MSKGPARGLTPDILGEGLVRETIPCRSDDEGPVVATLVHRRCGRAGAQSMLSRSIIIWLSA